MKAWTESRSGPRPGARSREGSRLESRAERGAEEGLSGSGARSGLAAGSGPELGRGERRDRDRDRVRVRVGSLGVWWGSLRGEGWGRAYNGAPKSGNRLSGRLEETALRVSGFAVYSETTVADN